MLWFVDLSCESCNLQVSFPSVSLLLRFFVEESGWFLLLSFQSREVPDYVLAEHIPLSPVSENWPLEAGFIRLRAFFCWALLFLFGLRLWQGTSGWTSTRKQTPSACLCDVRLSSYRQTKINTLLFPFMNVEIMNWFRVTNGSPPRVTSVPTN